MSCEDYEEEGDSFARDRREEGKATEAGKGETTAQSPTSLGISASIQVCGGADAVMNGTCHDFTGIPQLLVCSACFQSTVALAIDVSSKVASQCQSPAEHLFRLDSIRI